MEGFPVAGIAVPVEPSANGLLLNVEILAQPIDDHVERPGLGGVLADEMGTLVPRDPLRTLGLALGLDLAHLLDELVVQAPVVLLAEQLGNNDDVVVLQGTVKDLAAVAADVNAQVGTDESRGRVERLGVAAVATMRCLLGDALGWVRSTGVVLKIAELGVGLLVCHAVLWKLLRLGRSGLALLVLMLVAAAAAAGPFVVTRGGRRTRTRA